MKNIGKNTVILFLALLISGFLNFIINNTADALTGPVSVGLSANSTNIRKGESVALSWNSTNADFCVVHNNGGINWFGIRSISGNESVFPDQTASYFVTCSNNSGYSKTAQVTITVGEGSISNVSVNLTASSESIFRGESATLIWSSTNTVSCEASGYWSGQKPVFGSERVSPSSTVYYTLRCSNSHGESASDTQSIFVNPAGVTPVPTVLATPIIPIPTKISVPVPTVKPIVVIARISSPTNLKPNNETLPSDTKEVTLSWDQVNEAKYYAVRLEPADKTDIRDERNNCPGNPHYLCVNELDSTSIKIKIEPANAYNWWVHAVSPSGVFSKEASAKFSIEVKEAGNGNFLANILDGISGWALLIILAVLVFIFWIGYLTGKKRGKEEKSFESPVQQKPFSSKI